MAGYYALRGKSSYYTYDFPKACQDFRKSLQLDGNNEDIRIRLAQFEVPDETVTSEDASGFSFLLKFVSLFSYFEAKVCVHFALRIGNVKYSMAIDFDF